MKMGQTVSHKFNQSCILLITYQQPILDFESTNFFTIFIMDYKLNFFVKEGFELDFFIYFILN